MQTRSLKIIIWNLVFFQSFAHDVICLTYSERILSANSGMMALCAHLAFIWWESKWQIRISAGEPDPKVTQWLISEPLLVRYLFSCNSSVTEYIWLFSCANMSKTGFFGKSQWSREEKSLSPQISTKHAGIESSWRLHIWLEWADWLKHDWMQEQCNPIHSVFFKKTPKAGWASVFGSASSCNLMCCPESEGSEGRTQCKALERWLF